MQTEIRTAITELTKTASGLSESNLFWGKADEEAELPYLVISNTANPATRDTTPRVFEDFHLNFTIYAKDLSVAELLEIQVTNILDTGESALNALLSTFKAFAIIRDFRESAIQDADRIWQNVIRYRIQTEKII